MVFHGKFLNMNNKKIKILYGIQTTGNGHISRSIEIINKLQETEKYEISVLLSGEQKDIKIPENINVIHRLDGLKFNIQEKIGLINILKNNNFIRFFKDVYKLNIKKYDIILTDFEPITSWASIFRRKKIIGVGNHYKFLSKRFSSNIYYNLNKIMCKIISPINQYIYFDYFKSEKSCLPIIKKELINNKGKIEQQKNTILTYIHSIPWYQQLIELSNLTEYNFIIYTSDKKLPQQNIKIANFKIKQVNPNSFNNDLLKSEMVICNSGFQLTSEAIFLGKKLYIIPIKNQIEQIYNAEQLKNIGITSEKTIIKEKIIEIIESDFFLEINFEQQFENKIMEKINELIITKNT
jgi:uncharacterized protein (TIGR00661 family)